MTTPDHFNERCLKRLYANLLDREMAAAERSERFWQRLNALRYADVPRNNDTIKFNLEAK